VKTKLVFAVDTIGDFVIPAGVTSVLAKVWGAGGGGSTYYYANGNYTNTAYGGAGAYASSTFAVVPGNTIQYMPGTGGNLTPSEPAKPALGGAKNATGSGDGGAGGGGSVVALWNGSTLTVKLVAGGGGGSAGVEYDGGDGQAGSLSPTHMVMSAADYNGLTGGNGASAVYKADGAGGGGYVPGTAPGTSSTWYPGTGGYSYAEGTGVVLEAAVSHVVPHNTDPDYPPNAGVSGAGAVAGHGGAVVLIY